MQWKQGEHVAIVGQTGSGKTYLEARLLPVRAAVIVLRTKADPLTFPGFRTIRRLHELSVNTHHYVLEPRYEHIRPECAAALELAWKQGRWCIAVDELFYVYDKLKLGEPVERLLTQGRSLKISVVCGMQRPSRVTRFALSEATHCFAFHLEGRDVKLFAEGTSPRVIPLFDQLGRHDFVYFNRVSREVAIGNANRLDLL